MVRGLLWKPFFRYPTRRRNITTVCRPQSGNGLPTQAISPGIPSWSWAAIQGRSRTDCLGRNEINYHESNWLVRPKYNGRWTRDTACHATAAQIHGCQLELFGRPRRAKCLRNGRHRITLTAVMEDRTGREMGNGHALGDPNHVVSDGAIDICEDIVDNCWSLALTRKEGLVLVRDEDGRFRRIGTMTIKDLEWMISSPEEEVCII